jgi:hypothetical protein
VRTPPQDRSRRGKDRDRAQEGMRRYVKGDAGCCAAYESD